MSKTKQILMLNYEFPPLGGGAGNATYYLLKEFSKYDDLEIDLVTSSTEGFKIHKFSDNITIHYLDINKKGNLHFQSKKDLLTYSRKAYSYCKKLIQEGKSFDLVHAFFGIPCGYIAMKLQRRRGTPYVVSLRGSDVPFYNNRFYWLDKLVFQRISRKVWKKANSVITNSQGLKDLALETSPKETISIIYNGIDTEEFKPLQSKKKREKIIIVSTGRLIERKGYKYLIEAVKGLEGVKVWLVGDGNLKEELKEISKGSKSEIRFLGKKSHNELKNYLQKADIFCLPSLNEGMSNSVLEAMACGLPIITTDTGGSKELINGNGFIVNKHSSREIYDRINKYLKNQELIKEHGKMSRKLAEQLNWSKVAREYREVYDG